MKYLIQIFALVSILIMGYSCQREGRESKNIKVVQNYIAAVEASDHETMAALLSDEYRGYGPSHNDSTNKAQALASWRQNSANLYEKIQYLRSRQYAVSIPDGPNKGEWVSNWAELRISYKNKEQEVKIWANTTYQIVDGLIYRTYTFYNEADVLEQLGYVFINPSEL